VLNQNGLCTAEGHQLESLSVDIGGLTLTLETKEVARLADGSCILRQGGTTGECIAWCVSFYQGL